MRFKIVILRLLPLLFFLALSLPHHPFSGWLDAEFIIPYGFETMQFVADIGSFALGSIVFLVAMILVWRTGKGAVVHIGFWIVVGLMMYAADRTLIFNNIERIHFPQYTIMALLLGLSLQGENLIFLVTSFAGFADEFLQFSMDPQKTNYLDFNDIVLNILGAGLGVALLIAFRKSAASESSYYEKRFRTLSLVVTSMAAGLVLLALSVGRIVTVADIATNRSVVTEVHGRLSFILGFERHDQFWIKSDFGKIVHILPPVEGLLLISLLLVLFLVSFQWLKGLRGPASHSFGAGAGPWGMRSNDDIIENMVSSERL
ncbi:hypothetical protein D4R75_10975 [bacterium]|nr:MAG: hypothetical protein D4R75_10975 [bacterium]